MAMVDYFDPIIIDSGSKTCRAGFADDILSELGRPRVVIPSIVGRPRGMVTGHIYEVMNFMLICYSNVGSHGWYETEGFLYRR